MLLLAEALIENFLRTKIPCDGLMGVAIPALDKLKDVFPLVSSIASVTYAICLKDPLVAPSPNSAHVHLQELGYLPYR